MANDNSGTSKDETSHPGTPPLRQVIDPAARYYDESRRKREAYDKALKQGDSGLWSATTFGAHSNHSIMGHEGNAQSRSGFDSRTFRKP